MINIDQLTKEFYEVLEAQDGAFQFIEKWLPEISKELEANKTQILLLEATVSELRDELDYING